MIKLDIEAKSDTGCVREHNEDNFGYDAEIGLAVLADGMGGYKAGEVASAIAITSLVHSVIQIKGNGEKVELNGQQYEESAILHRALHHANQQVYDSAHESKECMGMGTTVSAAWFHDGKVSIAHIGDSRIYRYRDYRLELLTTDHTVVQELVDHGFYTREEARASEQRNIVTRALGIDPAVNIDLYDYDVRVGDLYLLCSDGLTDMVDDLDVANILRRSSTDLEYGAVELINKALSNGGKDNVTVIVVRVDESRTNTKSWTNRLNKLFSG
ncbi:MAG: Stp1/IreP family PP2C-type Ser/Thr phosphatase [Arenicellales bacterium]|jgi:serine/threonine protein phosphatase PrpC